MADNLPPVFMYPSGPDKISMSGLTPGVDYENGYNHDIIVVCLPDDNTYNLVDLNDEHGIQTDTPGKEVEHEEYLDPETHTFKKLNRVTVFLYDCQNASKTEQGTYAAVVATGKRHSMPES